MILDISKSDKIKYFKKTIKKGIVYKITNLLNNDFYIGSTINLYKRYYTHLQDMKTKKRTCVKLNRSVNKYGIDNFKFEIIAKCPIEYVIKLEQWFIDNLKPQYNIAKIAGSNFGIKRTEEFKASMSKLQKEKWKDEEYKVNSLEKLSNNWKKGEDHPYYGKKHSEEIKQKISQAVLNSPKSRNVKVINIETGEVYNTIKDCFQKNNINYKVLYPKLVGIRENDTLFKKFKN